MKNLRPASEYIAQVIQTIKTHQESPIFIREHKLWVGALKNYGWVTRLLVITAILFSLKLMGIFSHWWEKADVTEPLAAMSSVGTLFEDVASEGSDFLFVGGMKYVLLILLEVVIFHFCRRTLEVLSGRVSEVGFNDFIKAQIRMIKVSIRAWVMESIASILIKIGLGIFSTFEFLETPLIFAVQCYYLGFIVIDNYNEQFGMSIKESALFTRQFIGIAVTSGFILYLIMLMPLVGIIVGPILVSVAVTILMYRVAGLEFEALETS